MTPIIGLWSSGDRVVKIVPLVEGMAAADAFDSKPAALEGAVFLERLQRVLRAGGHVAAGRGCERGNVLSVEFDEGDENVFHIPSSFRSESDAKARIRSRSRR